MEQLCKSSVPENNVRKNIVSNVYKSSLAIPGPSNLQAFQSTSKSSEFSLEISNLGMAELQSPNSEEKHEKNKRLGSSAPFKLPPIQSNVNVAINGYRIDECTRRCTLLVNSRGWEIHALCRQTLREL